MTPEEYNKRLRRLDDIKEIKNLHHEYVYSLNTCEWDKMADCFAEEGSAHIGRWDPIKGKEEIREFFKDDSKYKNQGKVRDGHFAMMPVINVDDDKAAGHWLMYIIISHPETGNAHKWLHGRHDVEYIRENGEWKILSIIYTIPWPGELDSPP